MELDDLKQRWQVQDQRLDASIRLNRGVLRESLVGKAETALNRLSRWLWVELLLNLLATLLLGSFSANHIAQPHFWVPAAVLHLCVLALVIAGIRQLAAIARIDYGAPLVAIQKRLELLRAERIRVTKWTLLLAPLLWTPLFIVAMKGLFGVDAYASFGVAWLVANLLFGLLVGALGAWISRRYANRVEHSPFLQRLLRDIAGHNLTAATEFLQRLDQFETEASGTGS